MNSALDSRTGRGVRRKGEDPWMSVSDLMTTLMMVFLFIAIALMRSAIRERDAVKEVAVTYRETQVAIYEALNEEFSADLPKWDAEIVKETLEFKFRRPDLLFDNAASTLKPEFQLILKDFFPRFIKVLGTFRDSIDEVRIEGHTSSVWAGADATTGYFFNMSLSQDRTRAVLQHVFALADSESDRAWLKRYFSAVGFSSSRPILAQDGTEDEERSRRVTFRLVTNAETKIRRIIEIGGEGLEASR